MKINEEGLKLIMKFEGCILKPYRDAGGLLTIGYGHLIKLDEDFGESITEEQAQGLLREDVSSAEKYVEQLIDVPLNENQFSAIVSLVYNIGYNNFRKSKLREKINNKKSIEDIEKSWNSYINCRGVVLKGLVKRRAAEFKLFTRPVE